MAGQADQLLAGAGETDPRKRGVKFVGARITRGQGFHSGGDVQTMVIRRPVSKGDAFELGRDLTDFDINGGMPTGFARFASSMDAQKSSLGEGQSLDMEMDVDLGYDDPLLSEGAAFEDPDYRFPRQERDNPYGEYGPSYAPEGMDGLEDSVPNRFGEEPEWADMGEEPDAERERRPSGAIPFIDFEKGTSDGDSEYPSDMGLRMSLPPGERDIDRGDDFTSDPMFFTEPGQEQFGEDEGFFDYTDDANRRQTKPRTQGVNPNSTFARRLARMKSQGGS